MTSNEFIAYLCREPWPENPVRECLEDEGHPGPHCAPVEFQDGYIATRYETWPR